MSVVTDDIRTVGNLAQEVISVATRTFKGIPEPISDPNSARGKALRQLCNSDIDISKGELRMEAVKNLENTEKIMTDQNTGPCVFCREDYVEHLVKVAWGRVGTDSEKIAILKFALSCAHQRVLKHGPIMAWPEIWEAKVLKQLEGLVGKARFPRWAAQNLPFMSAKIRRSRLKLAIEIVPKGPASQDGEDPETIDIDATEVEAQQGYKPTNISQERSDKMEPVEYINKIQEILANQTQDEQAKIKNIFNLLQKDLAALISFPEWWIKDYPLTVQTLRDDLRRGYSNRPVYRGD